MTFAGFNLIKYVEAILALYATAVGVLFLASPEVLNLAIYRPWHDIGVSVWGSLLMLVGLGHASALWLNGRNSQVSRTVRAMASLAHFYVSLEFAGMFVTGGAVWGALTFGLLLPGLILPVMSRTIDDAKEALQNDR
jgi:uncharacterized membrane protein YhaH (DUF805 family)